MGEARRRQVMGTHPRQSVPVWRELPPVRVPAGLWAEAEAERDRRARDLGRPMGVEEFMAELIAVALEGLGRARARAERKKRLVLLPGEAREP